MGGRGAGGTMARGRRGGILTRSFVAGGGAARRTGWFASADVTAEATLGAGLAVLDQSFTEANLAQEVPFTIVRTRGFVYWRSDQFGAAELPFGALGFMVSTEEARVAGTASMPGPITSEDSDVWFVHQPFIADSRANATGGAAPGRVFQFDSRAMRKVEDGMAINVLLENGSTLHGGNYLIKYRMLIKYH